jgi:8-oxo-dGTP pyrophosphatase MutT (NUDIX family)
MSDAKPAPVTPVPAATVIVVRESVGGPEVLMLRRNPEGAFGGMWVFPGGRVDAEDGDPADELGAARNAAAREALEEAGIVVDPEALVPFSHWTPPEIAPRRFATWFFLAPASSGDVVIDGAEIHDHVWLAPSDVLARHAAGEIELAPPTWVTLHQMSVYSSLADLLAAAGAATPEHYLTRPVRGDAGQVLVWHGDASYESGVYTTEGPRHRLVMMAGDWRYERTY